VDNRADAPEKLLIVVVGPTAAGKTALAIELATQLGLEAVVSADARQVYRRLDIGTGKPTANELARMPHRLLSIIDPAETYSAAQFAADAARELADLHSRQPVALLVGGAGFYLAALLEGLPNLPAADPVLRAELLQVFERQGLTPLLEELRLADPVAYGAIDRQNPARVVRAVEVIRRTGRPFSSFRPVAPVLPYQTLWLGVDPGREELRALIAQRVAGMFRAGLTDEVRSLLAAGYDPGLQSLQTIGYREVLPHLQGLQSEADAEAAVRQGSIHYAKRQRTWFAARPFIHWLPGPDTPTRLAQALTLVKIQGYGL